MAGVWCDPMLGRVARKSKKMKYRTPQIWLAERFYYAQKDGKQASRPAVRVALLGIVIGVVVMLVTLCVVVGFKQVITNKISGFGAHIQVVNFDNNNTYELQPIVPSDSLLEQIRQLPHVTQVHRYYTKPGIIKTDDAFQGIVFKGTDYWDYFQANLLAGRVPEKDQEVLISHNVSRLLSIEVGDALFCYFVGEQVRVRKFVVSGLYMTGLTELDELFVLGRPNVVKQLNLWRDNQCSGIDVMVDDFDRLEQVADDVYFATANRFDEDDNAYYTQTIEQLNPQIFSWLDLLDMNVVIIIILMLCVSSFNIISGLIIMILDSVQRIGILKSLGATNKFIRDIFLSQGMMLIFKGVLWGNVIGLLLCLLQYVTHFLPLDPISYYVSYVPIAFPVGWILGINVITLVLSWVIMLAPASVVANISPSKVMHFE